MEKEKNSKSGSKIYFILGIVLLLAWLIGCVLLSSAERAEAAVEDYYTDVMALRDETKPYYALFYLVHEYGHEILVFFESDSDDSIPMIYDEQDGGRLVVKNGRCYSGYYINAYYGSVSNTWFLSKYTTISYIEGNMKWSSDVPMQGENWSIVDARPLPTEYSPEAPYVKFDSLEVYAPLATTPYNLKVFNDVPVEYADYTNWYWQYNGYIENFMGIDSKKYTLNMLFTCQFPTYEFIYAFWDDCVDQRTLLKKTPVSVDEWLSKNLEYETYQFQYNFVLDVKEDGTFALKIPYSAIHALLVYEYHDLLSLYGSCTEEDIDFCDVMMSYLYVSDITMNLHTTDANAIYYGRTILNHFSKGVYDVAVVSEVVIDFATSTPEEQDKAISDALQKGYEEAIKESEERIKKLEQELENATSLGTYDSMYEGQDLWQAVKSAGSGILSLLSTLTFIPRALGSIFVFFPGEWQDIMGYVMMLVIFFALWRAFKGK